MIENTARKVELLRSLSSAPAPDSASPAPARIPYLWIGLVVLLVAGLSVLCTYWLVRPTPAKPAPAAASAPTAASPAAARGDLIASGFVVARRQATVAAEVTGRVIDVSIEEGQHVAKGQLLAVLDSSAVSASLAAANARAVSAQASAAALRAQLEDARRIAARGEALAGRGFITQADLTTNRSRVAQLQAQTESVVATAAAARADLNNARVQVGRYVIRAPFSGVVVQKNAQPGEIISPVSAGGGFTRTGICTIVDMASLEVEVDVSEEYIGRVAAGQRVTAVLDAYPDEKIPGYVIARIPSADRAKSTVMVRVGFDRLDPRMLPDMAVKVTFLNRGNA
jgi:RND family efflux transporter MFP subunit